MLKHLGLFLIASVMCMTALAEPLWHCTATNTAGAVWNWYGSEHEATRSTVEKQCKPFNDRKACAIVCFPPRDYWRCYSHDTLPVGANKDPSSPVKLKEGTWYWSSFSRQIAINGARDACRHNSEFGGCFVDEQSCASSSGEKR